MSDPSFWSRLKRAHMARVGVVYLGAAWVLLQVADVLQDGLDLPDWVIPVTLLLLAVGFVVILATAWFQSAPGMEAREAANEVPDDWELDLFSLKEALAKRRLPTPLWARAIVGGSVVFALLFGIAGTYVLVSGSGDRVQALYAGETATLAVLPFQTSGSALDEWQEGMASLLSTGLDGTEGLRSVDSRTVLSRWNREIESGSPEDLATVLRVAESTGARFALEGSAASVGDEVRLVTRVHDLRTGQQVGTAQVEGSLDTPQDLVDRLGVEVLRVLFGGDVADLPRIDLAAVTTSDPEALRAYLRGESDYREGLFHQAVTAYEQAVSIDSTFALAYHRLFLAMGWSGSNDSPAQRRYGQRALELVDRLPEREQLLVRGTYNMSRDPRDPARLVTTLEEAVSRYPRDAEAWYLLGETYFHEPNLIMSPYRIEDTFARATELDPDFVASRIHYVEMAFWLHGDSTLAAQRIAAYREAADPDDLFLEAFELFQRLLFGDSLTLAEALAEVQSDPGLMSSTRRDLPALIDNPRLLDRGEEILPSAIAGPPGATGGPPPDILAAFAGLLAGRGRVQAYSALERLAPSAPARISGVYALQLLGLPPPEGDILELLDAADEPGTGPGLHYFAALLAADLGDASRFGAHIERLETLAEEAPDEETREPLADYIRVAHIYWRWRVDGDATGAAQALVTEGGVAPASVWKFWLGEIYQEMGRLREAEEAYLSSLYLSIAPVDTRYRLARIYDELGEDDRAREQWANVLAGWEGGDPELEPRVEEARERLAELQ